MRGPWFKLGAPLALAALAAAALAVASAVVGDLGRVDDAVARAQPPDGLVPADADASERTGAADEMPEDGYRCVQPRLSVPQTAPCAAGRGYPDCRWQVPDPPTGTDVPLYTIWRNTTPEHRWGRPGLVSLILASAAEYQRRWPGERMAIGDLDAPGPRHRTHDRGVDVDLYLTHAMMTRNEGRGRYVDNYRERGRAEVRELRGRVMDLARILAVCAEGQVRIYYNDPEIITPFRAWFEARGLRSSVGLPMERHNRLHEFHFHLTIPEDRAPLPTE